MIEQTTLLTYLAILVGFVFIPGPAVLLTLARASRSGTKVGLATGFGIAVGDIVHTLLAVVGISAVVLASALLFNIIKYLGAAYLVYLGIKAFLDNSAPEINTSAEAIEAVSAFKQAIVLEILNPKSAMFFLAFLPQFVNPANGSVGLQLIVFGLLFVIMGLISTVVVAVSAGRLGLLLRQRPTVVRWQNRIVGGIYCGLGLRLVLQEK